MKTDLKMKVQSIKIENLFEIFDYTIEYPKDESVLIITGPNGFGKTQVLNILYNLFNRKFLFFKKLVFDKITVCLNNNISIEILKTKEKLGFTFLDKKKKIESFDNSIKLNEKLLKKVEHYLPINRIAPNRWHDHRTDKVITIDDVLEKYIDEIPIEIGKNIYKINNKKVTEILDSINVHLIREQRLFKKVTSDERRYVNDIREREQTIMTETIQTYSDELRKLISEKTHESYSITQSLDSTYPNRLISEKKKMSKEEYDLKFKNLKNKQDKLMKNGLYKNIQKELGYSEDDAKALFVYLSDLEQKLSVFDDLLEKLELFTSILNERRFTYKSININREKGFYFRTTTGKELQLNQLSSGEQHEVILLYELIFKTKPNILVLIDEPEISLHVTWQKEFLEDLLKIIEIQKFQVLIATHSPSIINGRWDLVYNLEKTVAK